MHYNHTQVGHLMIIVMFGITLVFLNIWRYANYDQNLIGIFILILFIVGSFSTLNVMVDDNVVRIKFGYGIYRKRFPLNEIASVTTVRNHWYYGWGIRIWFWPRMMIYNVSGFEAVELIMKNGKRFRIGTDEPKKLERALLRTLKLSVS